MKVPHLDFELNTFRLFLSPQGMFSLPTFVAGVTWRSPVTKRPLPICTVHLVSYTHMCNIHFISLVSLMHSFYTYF